jgi:hypothetical protein
VFSDDRVYVISTAGSIRSFVVDDGTLVATTPIPCFKEGFGLSVVGDDLIVAASRDAIRMTL